MGNYTGLRVKATLKPESIPLIEELYALTWESSTGRWARLAEAHPDLEFLAEWSRVHRADFIPFGIVDLAAWRDSENDEGWRMRPPENGFWQFQCSLKNYEGEIQKFIDLVLQKIVVPGSTEIITCYCEDWEDRTITI